MLQGNKTDRRDIKRKTFSTSGWNTRREWESGHTHTNTRHRDREVGGGV